MLAKKEQNREALQRLDAVVEASKNITSSTDADMILDLGLRKLQGHLQFESLVIQHRLESAQLEMRRILRKAEQIRMAKQRIEEAQQEEDEGSLSAEMSQATQIHLAAVVTALEGEIDPEKQRHELLLLNSTLTDDAHQDAMQAERRSEDWEHTLHKLQAIPHDNNTIVTSQVEMYANAMKSFAQLQYS